MLTLSMQFLLQTGEMHLKGLEADVQHSCNSNGAPCKGIADRETHTRQGNALPEHIDAR